MRESIINSTFYIINSMKPLFSEEEFLISDSATKLPCECENCGQTFFILKKRIQSERKTPQNCVRFCSLKCNGKFKTKTRGDILVHCSNCGKKAKRRKIDVERKTTGLFFCSHSCAATYSNTHKTKGIRRSKLETLAEHVLNEKFLHLFPLYNDKSAIGSELDIYFPSLKLAFEFNGIFHYKPIFGEKKLQQIKANDEAKLTRCQKNNITLVVINTTEHNYITEHTSQKYIDVVINIIKRHASNLSPTIETDTSKQLSRTLPTELPAYICMSEFTS
jgi:hypothetical protein